MRLDDRIVFITGAGSGIGRASAIACAAEGARVACVDIDPASAEETAEAIREAGGEALGLVADAAREAQIRSLANHVAQTLGPVDVLVNNAGIARRHRVTEQDEAEWDEVIRVNLRSVFVCSKYVIPQMLDRGGSIVNMASVVGVMGVPNRAAYSTSKGAIVQLTRSMALDYARHRIRVNAICPGFTRTGMTARLFADPEVEQKLRKLHPLGRLGEPEDIAKGVVFLASDDASWITGQALAIDGGFTIGHAVDY